MVARLAGARAGAALMPDDPVSPLLELTAATFVFGSSCQGPRNVGDVSRPRSIRQQHELR